MLNSENVKIGFDSLSGEVLGLLKSKLEIHRNMLIEQVLANIENAELNSFEKGQIWTLSLLLAEIEEEIQKTQ